MKEAMVNKEDETYPISRPTGGRNRHCYRAVEKVTFLLE